MRTTPRTAIIGLRTTPRTASERQQSAPNDVASGGSLVAPPSPEHLRALLERLAGQKAPLSAPLPESALEVLTPDRSGLGYSQLNEVLLLLGFDRVSYTFFQFLADGTTDYQDGVSIKSFGKLEASVDRFREVALLRFGNVKFAFKSLARDPEQVRRCVAELSPVPISLFQTRHDPIRPIQQIAPEETYYLGYIIEQELNARLASNPDDTAARQENEKRVRVVEIGKANQDAYLASDHLDVYIATSMRKRHEFLAVSRLTKAIFSQPELEDLKLRWFDPTQAYCRDRIDKGLSEALMLRRAKCTIYFVQENDTLGKDSELASTLAQGKPVIAFVPEVDSDYAERLISGIHEAYPERDRRDLSLEQLQIFAPSAAWVDPVVRKWIAEPMVANLETITARLQAEIFEHYKRRCETLRTTHPLGIQVHLESGVANGVLVVRRVDDCARLVRRIVTGSLEFKISQENGAVVLREAISESVFRIATGDQMLTNAFWNFYPYPSR